MDAIIAALDGEIVAVRQQMEHVSERPGSTGQVAVGTLFGKPVVVARSGVGKVMAAICTQQIISNYQPARIIVVGIAGAIAPELSIGDVVIGDELLQHDLDATALGFAVGQVPYTPYRVLHSDPAMVSAALLVESELGKVSTGRILSGDRFITGADQETLRWLRDDLSGAALEMEGAAVALTATVSRVPFVVIRTISDLIGAKPDINLNQFLRQVSSNNLHFIAALLEASV